jgi:CRISPR-associated endonuclease/helicase Cas3
MHTDKWDTPVLATTLVQFLNTLFSGKNSSVRRMHQLCNSVIIIDEVQSIPVKCVSLFNLAVNFLTHICGSTVVLCSATQPQFEETEYPIIFDEMKSMTGDYTEDFELFRRTELVSAINDVGYTYNEAADFGFEKFKENGNVLIVVNTKDSAAKIFNSIKKKVDENTHVIHISTNMCAQHRRETLAKVRKLLDDNKPVICITTQLIEAGVDISFKCAIRSLAGMDNAAQTAGRCNRNGSYGLCRVYIINISDENISRLEEIRTAQDITRQIISNEKYSD